MTIDGAPSSLPSAASDSGKEQVVQDVRSRYKAIVGASIIFSHEGLYRFVEGGMGVQGSQRLEIDGQEMLARGYFLVPGLLLEAHRVHKETARVAIKGLKHIEEEIRFEEEIDPMPPGTPKKYQLNCYYWDLANPDFIQKLQQFPYKDRLVLEIVEDIDTDFSPENCVKEHKLAIKALRDSGIEFASDDYLLIASKDTSKKNSLGVFKAFNGIMNEDGKPFFSRVKIDGKHIRKLLKAIHSGEEDIDDIKDKAKELIKDFKNMGVGIIIAEWVVNEKEAKDLADLGFTHFQGRSLTEEMENLELIAKYQDQNP